MNENRKYAIFIDGDNISPRYLESILSEVSKEGEILVRRIYGDWTTTNMNGWKDLLLKIPVRPVQQFRNGLNATDNAIIMDAIELANTNKEINAICIVTSDTDYYGLALKIREYGLFVLGIGEQKSNSLWIKACNQFKYLENFSSSNPLNEMESQISLENLISKAYDNSRINDAGFVSLADLGMSVRSIMPDFDPLNYNHATLRKIIEALPDSYVTTKDNLVPPNYWVQRVETQPKNTGTIKLWATSYGFIQTEKLGDFYFTNSNISLNCRDKNIKKGDKVTFEILKLPNKNSVNREEQNGKAINVIFEK